VGNDELRRLEWRKARGVDAEMWGKWHGRGVHRLSLEQDQQALWIEEIVMRPAGFVLNAFQ
jgi:hypothetical protein